MENIAAQMLRRNGHKPYFYSRTDKENRENHDDVFVEELAQARADRYTTHRSA